MEVTLVRYDNNPSGRCQGCPINTEGDRSCCDDPNRFSGNCDGNRRCDPYFTFCLRPLSSRGRGCSNYRNATSSSRNDKTTIDFKKDDDELGLPNPLHLPGLTDAYSVRLLCKNNILVYVYLSCTCMPGVDIK